MLGVPQSATEAEIRRAYRKLAKENHPDANPGKEERFKEISAAYDVLSEPTKRKEYDEVRRLGPDGGAGGFGGGGRRRRRSAGRGRCAGGSASRTDNLGDLFGDILGRFGGPGRRQPVRRRGRAGGRRRRRASGATTSRPSCTCRSSTPSTASPPPSTSPAEATCSTCHGSGAAPGTSPVVCSRCGGRGVLDDNQGLFSFSRACPQCAGRGMMVETPCPTCRGTGIEIRPRQVKVRIPAGVDDGQRIRVKGKGGTGRRQRRRPATCGSPSGCRPTTMFGRKGRNLTLTVPITFAEAALGAEVTVPTLDGTVVLRVPPGTRVGPHLPGQGPGRRRREGRRRPARHRRGGRAHQAVGRRAGGHRGAGHWRPPNPPAPTSEYEKVDGVPWLSRCRHGACTSSRWPPSWPASTPRRCASTSGGACSTRPAPAAAAGATASATSTASGASTSSPRPG